MGREVLPRTLFVILADYGGAHRGVCHGLLGTRPTLRRLVEVRVAVDVRRPLVCSLDGLRRVPREY